MVGAKGEGKHRKEKREFRLMQNIPAHEEEGDKGHQLHSGPGPKDVSPGKLLNL